MAEETRPKADGRPRGKTRVLLCVVDETEEVSVALEFAALRARRQNGRVALLYVLEDQPGGFQHWSTVADLMREEARDDAEQKLQRAGARVQRWSGTLPIFYIREGSTTEEVIALIQEEPDISILILGAAIGSQGPGPLVTSLAGKMVGRLRVPVVIVPGNLSDEELDALA
jgi:nucleotide-binding universal stress UspA family protein